MRTRNLVYLVLLFSSFQLHSQQATYGANISYQVSGNQVKFRVAYYNTTKWEVRASVRILTNAPIYSRDFSRTGQFLNAYYKGSNTLISNPGATPSQIYVAIYESDYHTIPDSFWNTNNFAFFRAVDGHRVEDRGPGSYRYSRSAPYGTDGAPYTNFRQPWSFTYHGIDAVIYPYIDANGRKSLARNDSPRFKDFGTYGSYFGSSSVYINTATDKEGDHLIYRWYHPVERTQNGLPTTHNANAMLQFRDIEEGGIRISVNQTPCNDPTSPYYTPDGSGGGCNVWVTSGTISATYTGDHALYPIPTSGSDNFYLNPYTGVVSFTDQSNLVGYRANAVAVDQYVDGQLVGTVTSEVPFYVQEETTTNQNPTLTITQTPGIHYKTAFQYEVSSRTPSLTFRAYDWDTSNPIEVPVYKYVDPPANNGEVLLSYINTKESNTVSIVLNYNDPDGDDVFLSHYPIQDNLYQTTTTTFSYAGGTGNWSWIAPDAIPVADNVTSKTYRFMFYAYDNGGDLIKLNGKSLEALSVIVHKLPTVTITSPGRNSGSTSADETIPITITIGGIKNEEITTYTDTLTADDFTVENAVIKEITKTSSTTYTATLSPTFDAYITSGTTKVSLASNTIVVRKKGLGENDTIDLGNKASNEFVWTSNRVPPKVHFQMFDSKGNLLNDAQTTNDKYIVASIITSEDTNGFTESDVTIASSSGFTPTTNFTKIDGQKYTYEITPSDNSTGTVTLSIAANVFSNAFGANNLAGVVSQTGNASGNTHFTWSVDLVGPTLTISPTHNILVNSQNVSETVYLNFDTEVFYNTTGTATALTNLTSVELIKLKDRLNLFIANGYIDELQVIDDVSISATLNHSGGNNTITISLPSGIFQDINQNPSTATSLTYSYVNTRPYLRSLTKMGAFIRNSDGTFSFNRPELNHTVTSETIKVMFGFAGQSSGDAGYGNSRDGRIFDIAPGELLYNSEMVSISNFTYYGLAPTKTVNGVDFAEQLFTAEVTPLKEGVIGIGVQNEVFSNTAGSANVSSKFNFVFDQTPPTISFSGIDPQGLPVPSNSVGNQSYITIIATATEEIKPFNVNNISFSYSQKSGTVSNFTSINSSTFKFKLLPTDGDGQYKPTINLRRFEDIYGNENSQKTENFTWNYNTAAPSVSIKVYNDGKEVLNGGSISTGAVSITYVFSKSVSPVSNFDLVQFLNSNSSSLTFNSAVFNSDYTQIVASATAALGEVTTRIPENYFKDKGGILNTNSVTFTWTYDNSIPSVTISVENQGNSLVQNQYINSGTLSVTYTISQVLPSTYSNFSISELENILRNQISNGTLSGLVFDTLGSNKFTANIYELEDGIIRIGFPKDLIFDAAGKKNTSANDFVINFDATPPTAIFQIVDFQETNIGEITKLSPLNLKITTSESSYDLNQSDLTISSNATLTDFVKNDAFNYSAKIINNTSGQVTVTLLANSFTDVASNPNQLQTTSAYVFDNVRPSASFSSSQVVSNTQIVSNSVSITLTFSEPVIYSNNYVTLEQLIQNGVTNGNVENISWASSSVLNFEIQRVSNGTVTLTLNENLFFDTAFNWNLAASDFVFDFSGTVELTNVELTSNNMFEEDYTISYVYSSSTYNKVVPGTRTLLASNKIANLFVKNGDQITLNITANAPISQVTVTIDNSVYTATETGTVGTGINWFATHTIDSTIHQEGDVSFLVEYSDNLSNVQAPISVPTDGIRYKKDFTAPVLTPKLFSENGEAVNIAKELMSTKYFLNITSSENLYEEFIFSDANHGGTHYFKFQEGSNLLNLHYLIKYLKAYKSLQYHNSAPGLISYNFPYRNSSGDSYINKFKNTSYPYYYSDIQPVWGSGNYALNLGANMFFDLAGNPTEISSINIKLYNEFDSKIDYSIVPDGCSQGYLIKINSRSVYRGNWLPEPLPNTPEVIIESTTDSATYTTAPSTNWNLEHSGILRTEVGKWYYQKIQYDSIVYSLKFESSKWVRFRFNRTFGSNNQYLNSYISDTVFLPYDNDTPSLTGSTTLCGVGATAQYQAVDSYNNSITGGVWSVLDTSVASISSSGILTSSAVGQTEVIYTTSGGCEIKKEIIVIPTSIPVISANGELEVCVDETIRLSTTLNSGFKWYKDNVPLSDLTSSTIVLDQVAQSGTYKIIQRTPCGEFTSNAIKIKVINKPTATKININDD